MKEGLLSNNLVSFDCAEFLGWLSVIKAKKSQNPIVLVFIVENFVLRT